MKTTHIICPHCGNRMEVPSDMLEPDKAHAFYNCYRCTLSEPLKDYFVVAVSPDSVQERPSREQQSEHPVCESPHDRSPLPVSEPQVRPGKTMVMDSGDPYLFSHPGILVDITTHESVALSIGKQTVGRFDNNPDDCPDVAFRNIHQTASRKHIIIEVRQIESGEYIHLVSLYNATNKTLVDDHFLENGYVWKLRKGSTITLGMAKLVIKDKTDNDYEDKIREYMLYS